MHTSVVRGSLVGEMKSQYVFRRNFAPFPISGWRSGCKDTFTAASIATQCRADGMAYWLRKRSVARAAGGKAGPSTGHDRYRPTPLGA